MSCPKCPHCKGVEERKKIKLFHKKYEDKYLIDTYHGLFFDEDGVVTSIPSLFEVGDIDEFIKICEEYIENDT